MAKKNGDLGFAEKVERFSLSSTKAILAVFR
jgi:hypothetical protein